MKPLALAAALIALALAAPAVAQQQMVDPDFQPTVAHPAYAADGPRVVIDGAHNNFHKVDGQYAPFAALLRADGYRVSGRTLAFDAGGLDSVDVLVIANAVTRDGTSAFTEAEIAALEQWVRDGGRLLLIADHAPFGAATEALGARFGVGMGKGWAFEPDDGPNGMTSTMLYDRAGGRLGDHPITRGRNADEAIDHVQTFTGQSLIAPEGAAVLMRMGPRAWEAADPSNADALLAAITTGATNDPTITSAADRAQGLAFTHGEGRVVVLGEAGMLSAQLIRFNDGRPDRRFGMNVADQNPQFALNVLHWLTGLLP